MVHSYPTTRLFFLLAWILSHVCSGLPGPYGPRPRQVVASPAPDPNAGGGNQTSDDSDLADFGQTIKVLGLMERTDQDFVDGLALDLFSPSNRTLVVEQNMSPLPGNFVSGSSGEPFVALSNYSWVIKLNETANDLIAKVEVPYDPVMLQKMGIDQGNTYVGTLAPDGQSWVVSESQRNVHVSENKTRIIKMTSLDGEYMLLGRKTEDTSNIFVQYGQGATRTVNVTGGGGLQEAEFIDGLRFSIMSNKTFTMNVDIINGIPQDALPANAISLNSFAWFVNTSIPTQTIEKVEIRVPFNRGMIAANMLNATNGLPRLTVARRSLDATGKFAPLAPEAQAMLISEDRIKLPGLSQLDGQYILLVR
ncbi:hypothetical protein MRS44_017273 [Fusarium solani]|uniref:uncharacterized protein n=1 Tax=Fusarium solani TaxID=169388 RepID=UPI0032C48AE7|nr:hypothetical protein MRS44_017273 [Fusarium solani]